MRTIKFRGKRLQNGEWVLGSLLQVSQKECYIVVYNDDGYIRYEVAPETICQFTGLHDKDGKEIYEGDIIRSVRYKDFVYKVVYDDNRFASFCLERKKDMFRHYFGEAMDAKDCEVICNIHDNPELLMNND